MKATSKKPGKAFLSMFCPRCRQNRTRVLNKRNTFAAIYRRRKCLNDKCGARFTTYEIIKMKQL